MYQEQQVTLLQQVLHKVILEEGVLNLQDLVNKLEEEVELVLLEVMVIQDLL